jgi:hypothetical protein
MPPITRVPGGVGISSNWTVGLAMWTFIDYCRSKGDDVVVELYNGGRQATLTIAFSDEEDQCCGSYLLSLLGLP